MCSVRLLLPCMILATGALCLSDCRRAPRVPAQIQAVAAKAEQQVAVEVKPTKAVVKVSSPNGIGSAEVVLTAGAWPVEVVIQLQLKGLEELRFAYDGATVVASVASYGTNEVRENLSREVGDSATQSLSPGSPYWLSVTIVSTATTTGSQVPLADGYFEVTVPPAFLQGNHRAFRIAWVDFYR